MSFGRPPNIESFSGKPPALGSFPLDHYGECKKYMEEYMKCMKSNRNNNGECRQFSRDYLQCRMDKGLMAKDEMNNLGFADLENKVDSEGTSTSST